MTSTHDKQFVNTDVHVAQGIVHYVQTPETYPYPGSQLQTPPVIDMCVEEHEVQKVEEVQVEHGAIQRVQVPLES